MKCKCGKEIDNSLERYKKQGNFCKNCIWEINKRHIKGKYLSLEEALGI